MDNSPRFDNTIVFDAVDFSVFMALDCNYFAKILNETGMKNKSKYWFEKSRQISQSIHNYLWDIRTGFYLDRTIDGEYCSVQASSGFLPLLLDDIPKSNIEKLLKALNDPGRFATKCPVPSVSLAESSWGTDMWRGPTWVNYNYLIIAGLIRHGQKKHADALIQKTVNMVNKYYNKFGVMFEYYDSKDHIPPTNCDRKGATSIKYDIRKKMDSIRDYHWTAALVAVLLLKYHYNFAD